MKKLFLIFVILILYSCENIQTTKIGINYSSITVEAAISSIIFMNKDTIGYYSVVNFDDSINIFLFKDSKIIKTFLTKSWDRIEIDSIEYGNYEIGMYLYPDTIKSKLISFQSNIIQNLRIVNDSINNKKVNFDIKFIKADFGSSLVYEINNLSDINKHFKYYILSQSGKKPFMDGDFLFINEDTLITPGLHSIKIDISKFPKGNYLLYNQCYPQTAWIEYYFKIK